MQKLEELIAALESAKGPSRELDFWLSVRVWEISEETDAALQVEADEIAIGGRCAAKPFTSSIDAAVALCERALPGWRIENLCEWDAEILRDQGPWMCDLVQRRLEFFDRQSAKCSHAPTAALAILIATLRAKLSQEKNNADK
ncbi:hypothetical protein [Rhizobium sp. RCC_161_2]|uniref:hypothetical protein n=1 Tax=Rhizobium sp. RCC_161_2 TaxID=3239219 RepID=UPI00352591EE